MTILPITLITMMTHHVICTSSTTCSFNCIHSFLYCSTCLWYTILTPLSCTSTSFSTTCLVFLRAEYILHPWKKGTIFILEKRIWETNRCQWHESLLLFLALTLILSCFSHRAASVILMFFELIQLWLLFPGLGLGLWRSRSWLHVVRVLVRMLMVRVCLWLMVGMSGWMV